MKVLRGWNNMRLRNYSQNFHFWVNFQLHTFTRIISSMQIIEQFVHIMVLYVHCLLPLFVCLLVCFSLKVFVSS